MLSDDAGQNAQGSQRENEGPRFPLDPRHVDRSTLIRMAHESAMIGKAIAQALTVSREAGIAAIVGKRADTIVMDDPTEEADPSARLAANLAFLKARPNACDECDGAGLFRSVICLKCQGSGEYPIPNDWKAEEPRTDDFNRWLETYVGLQDPEAMRFSVDELAIAFAAGATSSFVDKVSEHVGTVLGRAFPSVEGDDAPIGIRDGLIAEDRARAQGIDPGASEALGEPVFLAKDSAYGIEDGAVQPRIAARPDLMVAIDKLTTNLRAYALPDGLPQERDAYESANLLDRLGAYLKGQDDRVFELAEQLRFSNADRDSWKATAHRLDAANAKNREEMERMAGSNLDLRKLIGDATPAVKLVIALAMMTATDIEFMAGRWVREAAREALEGHPHSKAPLYGDEDTKRAVDAIAVMVSRGRVDWHGVSEIVHTVAGALGMQRAQ